MTPNQHLARAILAARVLPPAPPLPPVIVIRRIPVIEPIQAPPELQERTRPRRRRGKGAKRRAPCWRTPRVVEIDPPLPALLRIVAAAHKGTVDDLRSRLRRAWLVEARSEFCYRAARHLGYSSSELIAKAICRDHITVRHAIGRYCERWGLAMPCGKADLIAERRRRLARSRASRDGRHADRMTMEQDA